MIFEKIILFGGSGMVGNSLKKRFSFDKINILSPTRQEVDLFEKDQVKSYIKLHKPDIIINVAGRVGGILFNTKNNYRSLIENSQIGINLISSAFESGVQNFLNISSSCIYPNDYKTPIKESNLLQGPLEPTNEGYAISKVLAIKACEFIDSKSSEFYYKTIIPCNLYGPGDKFEIENAHLIPGVINKMHSAKLNSSQYISMWGDGLARREFLFTDDLSDFILFILNKNFRSLEVRTNVGFGKDFTVNQYYDFISKIVGYKGEVRKDLTKPTGMKRKLMDSTLTKKMNWTPTHSMEEGIQKTYEYYLSKL